MSRTITCPNCGHHDVARNFHVVQSRRPVAERFWEKTARNGETGCLEWTGGISGGKNGGYGCFRNEDGRTVKAHIWVWKQKHGSIPSGKCVLHKCDNRRCVEEKHLFIGTRGENNADRDSKGRTFWKLSHEDVAEIRESDDPQSVLAELYGVSQGHISNLINGRRRISQ